jgi:hypothetical protein
MIETVPSTTGSAPYFNPKTQRFHDPLTKKMMTNKAAGAYKSAMDPEVLKPVQGPTEPNEQTGMLLNVLSGMKSSLEELVSLTKESLGLDKKDESRDLRDDRNKNLAGGDTDPGPSGGSDSGGFLEGLKGMFAGMKEKFAIGDKLKLLLLAGGLFALSKYSEQIIEKLEPILEYMKKKLIPRLKKIGKFFLKTDPETEEVSLDWTKILGVGVGVLVTKKLLGLAFNVAALKLGKGALKLLGIGGGGSVGFRLLPIAAALAAFSTVGDIVAGTNWGDEVTGGRPIATWKKGLAAAFAGSNNKEGSYGAAIKQGLKWGAMGAYAGSFFGPFGTLIGGTLGLLAGGIAGAMGSDKLLKILDGEADKMAETAMTNALSENASKVVVKKNAKKLLDQEDKEFEKILAETGSMSLAEASRMSADEFFIQTGQTIQRTREDAKVDLQVENYTGGSISGDLPFGPNSYDSGVYEALLAKKNMGTPLNEKEKEYIIFQEAVMEAQRSIDKINMERAERILHGMDPKEAADLHYKGPGGEAELMGLIDAHTYDMREIAEDNFGAMKGPAFDRAQYGDADRFKILKRVNRELEDLRQKTKDERFEKETGYKTVGDVPGVNVYKGADSYFNQSNHNFSMNKTTVHDDITMNQLATSR